MSEIVVVGISLFNLVLLVVQLILLGVNVATRRITPAAADQSLTARLEATQRDREMMGQLERAYQDQTQLVKTFINVVGEGLKFLAPVTPFKSDDELRKFILDVTKPGRPTVGEIDDDILVPTPEPVDNPHEKLPPYSAVNQNPDLEGEPNVMKIPAEAQVGVDQRILAKPPYYNLLFTPDAVPWVHKRPEGYEFGIEWLAGTYGFMYQPGVTVYPGTYLIKLVADCKFSKQLDNYEMGASVTFNNNQVTTLNVHPLAEGQQEYVWAIRFTKFGVINFDTWIKSAWAVEGGKVIVSAIRLETVPEGAGYTARIIA